MGTDFYRGVLDNAPWGAIVASTELEGRCLYVNRQFTLITGYELADIPTVEAWIHKAYPDPAYRQRVLDHWQTDTSPEHMHRDVTYRVTCRDGAARHVQFRASLLEPSRMAVMLLDVTERQETERARRDSEERYRLLVETSPFGIVLHSGTRISLVNSAALRIVGADEPEQVLGRSVMDFVHPNSVEVVARRMAEVHERGIASDPDEERFVKLDGTVIDVEVHGALVQHKGQSALQVVFTDISERKRLERERLALERRMQQAQQTESLTLLAGGVAHDLNNLLVGILGHADLARRPTRNRAALDGHLRAVVDAAQRAADLAGQLLAYAGRRNLAFEAVDLDTVVRETKGLLIAAVGRRAALRIELGDGSSVVEGDATQLRQILINLVSNAADATTADEGRITVATCLVAGDAPELRDAFAPQPAPSLPCVRLEVRDEGVGLDEHTRKRVFDPFFTSKAAGRGLGLAAALGIARAHGGTIAVQSALGEGTQFRVYLPAMTGATPIAHQEEESDRPWRGRGVMLLVDDEPVVRNMATIMLQEAGFEVASAASGRAALDVLTSDPSRVVGVILDLTMPGMSGEETFHEIRAIRSDLPVIVSSGFDEADTAGRFRDIEPAGFLQKPYTYDALIRVLRAALGKRR